MPSPYLSVIVAVYNAEQSLDRCIQSILRQSLSDMEIILVDDGSKDSSPEICDYYQKRDLRVHVIHQKNAGSVNARKAGLYAAKGEYVSYVDADDWIENTMYQYMLEEGDGADIIISGYTTETNNSTMRKHHIIQSGIYSGDRLHEFYAKLLFTGKFYESGIAPALWNKIFHRKLLLKIQPKVPDIIRMGEDAAITYPFLLSASKIVVLNELAGYHYINTEQTMSTSYDSLYFIRLEKLYEWLHGQFKERENDILLKQLPYYMMFLIWIGLQFELGAGNRNRIWTKIKALEKKLGEAWIVEAISGLDREKMSADVWKLKESISDKKICEWLIGYFFRRIIFKLRRIMRVREIL